MQKYVIVLKLFLMNYHKEICILQIIRVNIKQFFEKYYKFFYYRIKNRFGTITYKYFHNFFICLFKVIFYPRATSKTIMMIKPSKVNIVIMFLLWFC